MDGIETLWSCAYAAALIAGQRDTTRLGHMPQSLPIGEHAMAACFSSYLPSLSSNLHLSCIVGKGYAKHGNSTLCNIYL